MKNKTNSEKNTLKILCILYGFYVCIWAGMDLTLGTVELPKHDDIRIEKFSLHDKHKNTK